MQMTPKRQSVLVSLEDPDGGPRQEQFDVSAPEAELRLTVVAAEQRSEFMVRIHPGGHATVAPAQPTQLMARIVAIIDAEPGAKWTARRLHGRLNEPLVTIGDCDGWLQRLAYEGEIRRLRRDSYESLATAARKAPMSGGIASAIVDLLESAPERVWSPQELRDALGDRTLDDNMSMLGNLVKAGYIHRVGKGRYRAISSVAKAHGVGRSVKATGGGR